MYTGNGATSEHKHLLVRIKRTRKRNARRVRDVRYQWDGWLGDGLEEGASENGHIPSSALGLIVLPSELG